MFNKIKKAFADFFSDEIALDSTINVRETFELTLKKDWGLLQRIEEDTNSDVYDCSIKINFYVPIEDVKELCKKVKRDICEQGDRPHDD